MRSALRIAEKLFGSIAAGHKASHEASERQRAGKMRAETAGARGYLTGYDSSSPVVLTAGEPRFLPTAKRIRQNIGSECTAVHLPGADRWIAQEDGTVRIAILAPLVEPVPPPLYGGTERVVSLLTEELVRRGHQVTLFAYVATHTAIGW
jgi:hypothetical protein